MGIRSQVRSIISKFSRWFPAYTAIDHPSDGGITGEGYPEEDPHND